MCLILAGGDGAKAGGAGGQAAGAAGAAPAAAAATVPAGSGVPPSTQLPGGLVTNASGRVDTWRVGAVQQLGVEQVRLLLRAGRVVGGVWLLVTSGTEASTAGSVFL